MNLLDLREFEDNSVVETDLCIIGSGPAGLSIAKEFQGTNIDVWVLESGGLEDEPETQALYKIESIGAPRVIDQENIRTRIFGGSSHVWTGRCAPFDKVDFQHRDWVPYSGWPFPIEELTGCFERAGYNLGLGPHCYNERLWQLFRVKHPTPEMDEKLLKPTFWQFSRSPNQPGEPTRFGRDFSLDNAPNIRILLHANVTHINTNEEGTRLESVEVSTLERKIACVKAKAVILCCGGIENARIMLASNRFQPHGVGNQNDTVGRFLMDHPLCRIGHFELQQANQIRDRFGHYWLDTDKGRHTYLHGVSLAENVQRQDNLVKCSAYIEESDSSRDDPWEVVMRAKDSLSGRSTNTFSYQDSWKLLSHSLEIGQGMYRRVVKHRPQLRRVKQVELHCMLEQLPDPDSRLTLSEIKKDALGMPLSKINWKLSEVERQSVRRLSQLICQEFPRMGLPKPHLAEWINEEKDWVFNVIERAHPTGTTRISTDPKTGVVDLNCQVHGVKGLFIAGSSVFPTSGTANPTLMIIAMALRLADWLKGNYFKA